MLIHTVHVNHFKQKEQEAGTAPPSQRVPDAFKAPVKLPLWNSENITGSKSALRYLQIKSERLLLD